MQKGCRAPWRVLAICQHMRPLQNQHFFRSARGAHGSNFRRKTKPNGFRHRCQPPLWLADDYLGGHPEALHLRVQFLSSAQSIRRILFDSDVRLKRRLVVPLAPHAASAIGPNYAGRVALNGDANC